MNISVCLASYNGCPFIREQIASILSQLDQDDELIISDDGSSDDTLKVVNNFSDCRIRFIINKNAVHSPISNFENALYNAKYNYIFLSDQDDIWMPNKVHVMSSYLSQYDVVVSNCMIVNKQLEVIKRFFFRPGSNMRGFFNNLYDNHYLGCCMAFRREVLETILPFPKKISMHDIWIGLCAEVFFHPIFIDDVLIMYRRHGNNASNTAEQSVAPLSRKICSRLYYVRKIFKLIIKQKLFKSRR